jgi:hypothetical protein
VVGQHSTGVGGTVSADGGAAVRTMVGRTASGVVDEHSGTKETSAVRRWRR